MTEYDDLNDDLSDLLGGTHRTATRPVTPPPDYKPPTYFEPCPKCRGTGQTPWGTCFKCQGKRGKTFKTSPDKRAHTREQTAKRRAVKATERHIEKVTAAGQYIADHLEEVKWLRAASRQNTERGGEWIWPQDMLNAINHWGGLTENQLAAVHRCMEKDRVRAEERKAREASATVIDISRIEAAFEHARAAADGDGEGIKWLKLRLDTFTFSPAGPQSKNPGAIYVKEGETYVGKVMGGKFIGSYACTDDQEKRIIAAAADPAAAAKAYGMRTGSCSCCGRELTNRESLDLGIGPICASKYGWAS